jgi:hypothetical protein
MRPHGQNNSHAQLESWVARAEALCAGESAAAAGTRGHRPQYDDTKATNRKYNECPLISFYHKRKRVVCAMSSSETHLKDDMNSCVIEEFTGTTRSISTGYRRLPPVSVTACDW